VKVMDTQNIFELSGRDRHRQQRRAQVTIFYLNPQKEDVILDVGCAARARKSKWERKH